MQNLGLFSDENFEVKGETSAARRIIVQKHGKEVNRHGNGRTQEETLPPRNRCTEGNAKYA